MEVELERAWQAGSGTPSERYAYYIRCERLKSNREQCKAPAMKGTRVCYKHAQQDEAERRRVQAIERLRLPSLKDAHSIQTTLNKVMQAILLDEIDERSAGIILRELQEAIGTYNARAHNGQPRKK